FPLPMLPRWIQRLAMFFPSTYLVSTFQGVMAQAESLPDHWPEMLVLVTSGVFGLLFAIKLFRWEKAEKPNLIENFDGIQASEGLLSRWQISTDSDASGHSMAEISLLTPGAEGTRHAMRLKGHLAPGPKNAQGYVSARYEVKVPAGSRDLRGIEFEARGEPRIYQVGFQPPKAAASSIPEISFVPGEAWQNVRVPIAWLA